LEIDIIIVLIWIFSSARIYNLFIPAYRIQRFRHARVAEIKYAQQSIYSEFWATVLVEFKPERKDTLSMPRLAFSAECRLTFHLKYDRKTLPAGKTFLPFNIGYSHLFAMNDGLKSSLIR